ncbi:Uncharacterized MFS-type transporter, partial [hydrothermal vent metagenome]
MDKISKETGETGWKTSAFAAILMVAIVGMSFGLGVPLLSMNLELMTGSGLAIGINVLSAALSTVAVAPFAPKILARFPVRPLLIFCLLLAAFSFVFYRLFENVGLWLIMRFVSGLAITVLFIASETWISQLTPEHLRARMLSVYSVALAAGFGLGGLLVAWLGIAGWVPFLAGALICALGVLPLLLPGPQLLPPDLDETSPRVILSYFGKAPRIMLAGLAFGAIETAATHFSPIWALRAGMEQADAIRLIAVGAVGVIALQFPIGWLGDKMDRHKLLLICGLATLVAPLAMWMTIGISTLAVYSIFFVYVGMGEGIYILALVLIGQKFSKKEMAAATAALILMYGLGSMVS